MPLPEYNQKMALIDSKLSSMGTPSPRIVSSGDDKISKSDLIVLERIPFLEVLDEEKEMVKKLSQMMESTTENLARLKKQEEEDIANVLQNKMDRGEQQKYDDGPQKTINKEVANMLTNLKDGNCRAQQ